MSVTNKLRKLNSFLQPLATASFKVTDVNSINIAGAVEARKRARFALEYFIATEMFGFYLLFQEGG